MIKMINIEAQKEHFKNHVAKFTDYGNIKILDFKNPDSIVYQIRFIFEEDRCKLHIALYPYSQLANMFCLR